MSTTKKRHSTMENYVRGFSEVLVLSPPGRRRRLVFRGRDLATLRPEQALGDDWRAIGCDLRESTNEPPEHAGQRER